jgi:hypothetical protein
MLAVLPIDSDAIEKQLESADAPISLVSVSTIVATGADGLIPGERLQQEDAPARLHRHGRLEDVPLAGPSNQSDVYVRSFALAFVGLLCATVVGFVLEIRPLKPDSPDYGYDEAFGTVTSSLPSANVLSNCSDDSLAIAGASKDSSDTLRASAIAAGAATSPTELHANGIGGNHAE